VARAAASRLATFGYRAKQTPLLLSSPVILTRRRMRASFSISLLLVSVVGCASRPSQFAVADSSISAGDRLHIVFNRGNGATGEVYRVVDSAGNVSMPFGVSVRAAGAPLDQVGRSIEKAYNALNCFSPSLQVSVSKSR
jgi:protein involved in polysaccharide export with SLBB domain